jgi:hypothetical protein
MLITIFARTVGTYGPKTYGEGKNSGMAEEWPTTAEAAALPTHHR